MPDAHGQRPNTTHRIMILCGLYVFALAVRLVYLFALVHPAPLTGDEPEYVEPAEYLASGRGYAMVPQQSPDGVPQPTAYRPPGPAVVLAAVFAVTGPGVLAARLTWIALASLSAPLAFALTRRLGGPGAALLAGLACSIYPSWVHYSVIVLSEAVYIPVLLALLVLTDAVVRTGGWWRWLGLGVLWGLAALVRPHAVPCAVLIGSFLFVRQPRLAPRLLLVCVGIGAVLGGWAARNAAQLGHPVLLATEGGEALLGANNPYVWFDANQAGMWKAPVDIPEYRDALEPVRDEVERDRVQNRLATAFIREHPAELPAAVARKLWRWLTPVPHTGGVVRVMVVASYVPLLGFLLYGALTGAVRRSFLLAAAVAVTAASCVITAVYWGNLTRGRLPLEIMWLPWAAVSAHHAVQQVFGPKAVARETDPTPLQPELTPGG